LGIAKPIQRGLGGVRVTRGENHHIQGAGLGLAIARRIAQLLGGDATLATEVHKGSTFTFRLPS
jgi:two-component system aerobic respiration control sensor histidine kinase ArcB